MRDWRRKVAPESCPHRGVTAGPFLAASSQYFGPCASCVDFWGITDAERRRLSTHPDHGHRLAPRSVVGLLEQHDDLLGVAVDQHLRRIGDVFKGQEQPGEATLDRFTHPELAAIQSEPAAV